MGDFYELFHDDAEIAADVLGLSLTSRDKNAEQPIPMAGFPWHGLKITCEPCFVRATSNAGRARRGIASRCKTARTCGDEGVHAREPLRRGLLEGDEQSLLAPWCSVPTPWVWQSSTLRRARHGRPRTVAPIVSAAAGRPAALAASELVMTPKTQGTTNSPPFPAP